MLVLFPTTPYLLARYNVARMNFRKKFTMEYRYPNQSQVKEADLKTSAVPGKGREAIS